MIEELSRARAMGGTSPNEAIEINTKNDNDDHEKEMGDMLPLNKISDGRHYFMLATYNLDPIKLFMDNKKTKIKNFITFPNVA
jgi:hypothetical protein